MSKYELSLKKWGGTESNVIQSESSISLFLSVIGYRIMSAAAGGGVDVDRNSNYRNPTYSNMGCYSRNNSVDLFLKYEIAH